MSSFESLCKGERTQRKGVGSLMKADFAFCGIPVSDLGLEYAPDKQDTYVYRPSETNVHEETFDGHDGGYIYGSWRNPKEFILRCFFEEKQIDRGILSRIHALFRPGKSGKLIFSRRPWCYYYATVINVDDKEITNYLNGIVTITLKAAYPYARSDVAYTERTTAYNDDILLNSAIYDKREMITPYVFENLTKEKPFILGNPGTEYAAVGVTIQGEAPDGVIIKNKTTNQEMKIVQLTHAATTDVGKSVVIDGINGKTILSGPTGKQFAFLYHSYGSLSLEPAYPCKRDIYIEFTSGSAISTPNIISDNYIGQYIFVKSEWYKILAQPNRHTFIVDRQVISTGRERSTIMLMNELEIKPVTTMDIRKISFDFKPTFA
jgi:hypothetical protein